MQPRAADRKSPGQWNECTKQIKGERLAAIVRSSHSSRLAFLYIYTSYSYIITYYLRVICNCPGWRCSLLRHSSHLYNRSSIDRYQKHEQQIRFFFEIREQPRCVILLLSSEEISAYRQRFHFTFTLPFIMQCNIIYFMQLFDIAH